jgi:AcrR family transcriptional regulator
MNMPKGIPLTEEELTRRRGEIMHAALHLFVQKGFPETSMREIAEASGVGKSTLYDYFPSKDDLLIAYVADEVQHMKADAKMIMAQELSVPEKFRRIMRKQLEYLLANKLQNLKISYETQRLGTESLQRIQKHRHAYQDMLCDLMREGIQKGEFRPVNPMLAIRGMYAMLTATVYTTRPTGSMDEMLSDAFDIIFEGLKK